MNDLRKRSIIYKMVERIYKDIQADICICIHAGINEAEYINNIVQVLKDTINLISRYEVKEKEEAKAVHK